MVFEECTLNNSFGTSRYSTLLLWDTPIMREGLPASLGGYQEVFIARVLGVGVGSHHQALGIPET